MDTGARIEHIRKIRGETRAELASLLGIHPTTVALWERGKRNPGQGLMKSLLRAFSMSAGQFYSLKLPTEKGGRR